MDKKQFSSWPTGLSWTRSHWERTTAPLEKRVKIIEPTHPWVIENNNLVSDMFVRSGPFLFLPSMFGRIYFYIGFRPTADWPAGFGDEGWRFFTNIARWLKKHDWGNVGTALRRAKKD